MKELERIAKDVVKASMKLHMALGPGLLESVYTVIPQKKLQKLGYRVERKCRSRLRMKAFRSNLRSERTRSSMVVLSLN